VLAKLDTRCGQPDDEDNGLVELACELNLPAHIRVKYSFKGEG
jgi:hypothetical protein